MVIDFKTCPYCYKVFYKKDYLNNHCHNSAAWDRRIYCKYSCMTIANKERVRGVYKLKKSDHNGKLTCLNEIIKGDIVYDQSRINHTNPDIIKDNKYI